MRNGLMMLSVAALCATAMAQPHVLPLELDGIVEELRKVWKPLGGDGIYVQTFTEQDRSDITV